MGPLAQAPLRSRPRPVHARQAPPARPTDLIQGTKGPVDTRVRPNERGPGRPGYQPASPATHIITVDTECLGRPPTSDDASHWEAGRSAGARDILRRENRQATWKMRPAPRVRSFPFLEYL
jgi:hypothetical protein